MLVIVAHAAHVLCFAPPSSLTFTLEKAAQVEERLRTKTHAREHAAQRIIG